MPLGITRRGAKPLLRTVGGKPHAADSDHEEDATRQESRAQSKAKPMLDEEDINAEPMSSDEELKAPTPRQPPSSRPKIQLPPPPEDTELKKPPKKAAKETVKIKRPASGTFEKGRAAKRAIENNKENATSTEPAINDDWMSIVGVSANKKPKTQKIQYGNKKKTFSSNNIHARPPGKSGSAPSQGKLKVKKGNEPKSSAGSTDEDSDSDVSMKSLEESSSAPPKFEDPELRTKESKNPAPKSQSKRKSTALDDAELTKLLDEPVKAPRLIDQLGGWVQDQAAASGSQPASSAPEESLHHISEYIEQLPQDDIEGTRCGLCKAPVEIEDYWEFWKDKQDEKTVKNKTAFCNMHKVKSAQAQYKRAGYPMIVWKKLPKRIRKHRTQLLEILNNDRPSAHRDRYEPLALTGKAAAVPTRRKDLPKSVQEELESYALDDQSTYPGYYGPRGRRLITEAVMTVLKNEVKNCDDPVVQGSGPAAFVQAVIVPEAAVLLIMDDCKVGREEAERIREETYEMGILLHEEIEDQVEVRHSEDENEYHDS